MNNTWFVTGTSTEVGKTEICVGLLEAGTAAGLSTLAIKPVASGSDSTPDGLRNADAIALHAAMSIPLGYEDVNPFAFAPAIAPHIAARQAGVALDAKTLAAHCRKISNLNPALTLIEGAGGWRVPLNEQELFSDVPRLLGVPVILVVSIELGCINHALLSCEAINNDGLQLAGWIANRTTENMPFYDDNVMIIKNKISSPLLGEIPFQQDKQSREEAKYIYKNIVKKLLNRKAGLEL